MSDETTTPPRAVPAARSSRPKSAWPLPNQTCSIGPVETDEPMCGGVARVELCACTGAGRTGTEAPQSVCALTRHTSSRSCLLQTTAHLNKASNQKHAGLVLDVRLYTIRPKRSSHRKRLTFISPTRPWACQHVPNGFLVWFPDGSHLSKELSVVWRWCSAKVVSALGWTRHYPRVLLQKHPE